MTTKNSNKEIMGKIPLQLTNLPNFGMKFPTMNI